LQQLPIFEQSTWILIQIDSFVTIMYAVGNNTIASSLLLTPDITIACSPKHPSCMYFIKAVLYHASQKQANKPK
jgi:hypothetical protein